jgi:hypothetical protein
MGGATVISRTSHAADDRELAAVLRFLAATQRLVRWVRCGVCLTAQPLVRPTSTRYTAHRCRRCGWLWVMRVD